MIESVDIREEIREHIKSLKSYSKTAANSCFNIAMQELRELNLVEQQKLEAKKVEEIKKKQKSIDEKIRLR